jgi:hypothetical protein
MLYMSAAVSTTGRVRHSDLSSWVELLVLLHSATEYLSQRAEISPLRGSWQSHEALYFSAFIDCHACRLTGRSDTCCSELGPLLPFWSGLGVVPPKEFIELLTLLPGVWLCPLPFFSSLVGGRPLAPCMETWEPTTPFGPSFVCAWAFSKFFFDLNRKAIVAPKAKLLSAMLKRSRFSQYNPRPKRSSRWVREMTIYRIFFFGGRITLETRRAKSRRWLGWAA